ncbi:MAG: tetratricopeptide repeat protein [Saprospiraceae bacterium]
MCVLLVIQLLLVGALKGQDNLPVVYNSSEILEKARLAIEDGHLEDALLAYQQILPQDPAYLQAQLDRSQVLNELGRSAEAIHDLHLLYEDQLIKDEPDHLIYLASLYIDDSLYAEAAEVLDKVVALTPNHPYLYFILAQLSYRQHDTKAAFSHLMHSLELHPNHLQAHSFLGRLCLEEGYIIEGYLALLTAIALNPESEISVENVRKLNVRLSNHYLTKTGTLMKTAGTDQFDEIEAVLRNQLPLSAKYQLNCDVDEPVTRNIQALLEYSAMHSLKGGFFERTYMPFLQAIQQGRQGEVFLYYLLGGFKEDIGKKLKAHAKEVLTFDQSFIQKHAWDYLGRRTVMMDGQSTQVSVLYEDGFPFLKGPVNKGVKNGHFWLMNRKGQLTGDLQIREDELDGIQHYYHTNGIRIKEAQWAMGVQSGPVTEFHPNGNVSEVYEVASDQRVGKHAGYYPMGGKAVELTYGPTGEIEGKYVQYFPDGSVKETGQYRNGEAEGVFAIYNEHGDQIERHVLYKGFRHGPDTMYWDGQTIRQVSEYRDGKYDGYGVDWKYQGRKERAWTAKDGILIQDSTFSSNGMPDIVMGFSSKGDLESIQYFDGKGRKYFEEILSKGKLTKGIQYHLMGDPVVSAISNTTIRALDLEGRVVLMQGEVQKGAREGKWEFYHANGEKETTTTFEKGIVHGAQEFFHDNGNLYLSLMKQNGKIHGQRRFISFGKTRRIDYFLEDEINGPVLSFGWDGGVSYESWQEGSVYVTPVKLRYPDGKLKIQTDFIGEQPWRFVELSPGGDTLVRFDYTGVQGEVNIPSAHSRLSVFSTMVNGVMHGSYRIGGISDWVYKATYVNGVLDGMEEVRYPHGTMQRIKHYYNGIEHGRRVTHHPNGALQVESTFVMGEEEGQRNYYYQNGAVMRSIELVGDTYNGEEVWYAFDGHPVVSLGFIDGQLYEYRTLDANGDLGNRIAVHPADSLEIRSYWPNGQLAADLQMIKSNHHGPLRIFNSSGLTCIEREYFNGWMTGRNKEFYDNGQIFLDLPYQTNDRSGEANYYFTSGELMYRIHYDEDELHGPFTVYQNGKAVNEFNFEYGELSDNK